MRQECRSTQAGYCFRATTGCAELRCELEQLDDIDWDAVKATDFRDPAIKEGKQAELLVERFVPPAFAGMTVGLNCGGEPST